MISSEKSKNLYLLLMSSFTNLKNVVCCLNMSTVNQVREIIIAVVNGIQRILYENDSGMSPFSNASVARPMPHPGQGILVANLNKQSVCWLWFEKLSRKTNAKYPPTIEKIVSRYLA